MQNCSYATNNSAFLKTLDDDDNIKYEARLATLPVVGTGIIDKLVQQNKVKIKPQQKQTPVRKITPVREASNFSTPDQETVKAESKICYTQSITVLLLLLNQRKIEYSF